MLALAQPLLPTETGISDHGFPTAPSAAPISHRSSDGSRGATPAQWSLGSARVSRHSWDSDGFCPGQTGWLGPYLCEVLGYSSPSIGIRYLCVLQVHNPLPHVFVEQHRLVMATWGCKRGVRLGMSPGSHGLPAHRWIVPLETRGTATTALARLLAPTGTAVALGRLTQWKVSAEILLLVTLGHPCWSSPQGVSRGLFFLLGFSKPLDLSYPALNYRPSSQHNAFRAGEQLAERGGMC